MRIRTVWVQFVSGVILAAAVFLFVRFHDFIFPPPPGYCVALLGLLAVVMTLALPKEPSKREKATWIGAAFLLMTLEMWAITHDKNQQTANFQQTTSGLTTAIQQSQVVMQQAQQILQTTQQVGTLAQQNLENLTGGDSVSYIAPQPPSLNGSVPLAIVDAGSYPLTGVTVVISDITDFPFKVLPTVFVGTLSSHVTRMLDVSIIPNPVSGVVPGMEVATFSIDMYAQNGISKQLLQFRRGKKMLWDYRSHLVREVPMPGSMIPSYLQPSSDVPQLKFNYEWLEDRKP